MEAVLVIPRIACFDVVYCTIPGTEMTAVTEASRTMDPRVVPRPGLVASTGLASAPSWRQRRRLSPESAVDVDFLNLFEVGEVDF